MSFTAPVGAAISSDESFVFASNALFFMMMVASEALVSMLVIAIASITLTGMAVLNLFGA